MWFTKVNGLVMKMMLISFLLNGLQSFGFNGIESYQHQLQGTLKKGDTLIVKDEKFLNPAFDWQKIHNKMVTNIITFGLYRDSGVVMPRKAFRCEIDLKVEYWSQPGQADPIVEDHIKLEINYDTAAGVSYKNEALHQFQNGHRVRITINDITSAELGTSLPAIFSLRSQVIVERIYDLDRSAKLLPQVFIQQQPVISGMARIAAVTPSANSVKLVWTGLAGPQEYDLEWTFIGEESDNGRLLANQPSGVSEDVLKNMFRNNSTRVTVQKNDYDITLVHDARFLLVRIRQVQYLANGFRDALPWEYQIQEGTDVKLGVIDLGTNIRHEGNLNWQYSATYMEEGKKKEIVSYYDGTLHNRQTVTVNNTDNQVVIKESIYDEFGRPVVNILPVPLKESVFKYYPGLHIAPDNTTYNFRHVYGGSDYCIAKPASMSTSSGAAKYFSPQNEFLSGSAEDLAKHPEYNYIPDAGGYPFSVTRYTADNTGRVGMQGGVGELFQPGSNQQESKAGRYYYGKPTQWELDRLFGNDVGNYSHYLKSMIVNPNGQITISYQNKAGQTIATALTGNAPTNVDGVTNKPAVIQQTEVILSREFSFDPSKMKISATTTHLNEITGPVRLSYDIQQLIKQYSENGVNICSNCYYDLDIWVTDDCGKDLYHNIKPLPIGSLTENCGADGAVADYIDMVMDIGTYYITFELSMSEDALRNYTKAFISKNTNLKGEWSFINNALLGKDFFSCFNDCVTCKESLGDLSTFSHRVKERLTADGVSVSANEDEINTWINNLYGSLVSQCAALKEQCVDRSPCADLADALRRDVSPGGQYAIFDGSYTAVEPSINVLNLYWRTEFPASPKTSSNYIAEQFEQENGEITSPYDSLFTVSMLVKYWKSDWAEKFEKYHPEYCALEYCRATDTILIWNERLKTKAQTIADIPTYAKGAVYNKGVAGWLADHDPFFTGIGHVYHDAFVSDLENYSKNVAGGTATGIKVRSLSGFVDYMLYCADYTGNTNVNNIGTKDADNWTNCVPLESCRLYDREWVMYRDKYLELKDKYYQQLRNTAAYCGEQCVIGSSKSYPVGDCPTSDQFLFERLGSCGGISTQSAISVGYVGMALSRSVRVYLYLPEEYKSKLPVTYVTIPAGQTMTTFCLDNSVPLSSIRVSAVDCSGASAPRVYSCAGRRVDDFQPLTFNETVNGVSVSRITYTYHGPSIPVGGGFRVYVYYGNRTGQDDAYPIWVDHSNQSSSWEIEERGPVAITNWRLELGSECYEGTTNPGGGSGGCNVAYSSKTSRITNISYNVPGVSTDPAALASTVNNALAALVAQNCEAQVDGWMAGLAPFFEKNFSYLPKQYTLRNKLLEICKLGGDISHQNGASTLPAGKATAEDYRSFGDAIRGVLVIPSYTMDMNPYLITSPYPYEVVAQTTERSIESTNEAVCNALSTLMTAYTAAGSGGSFYAYLQQEYGASMTLSEAELGMLQRGCSNCRYLLERSIKLPVFLDGSAKGCITSSEYRAAMTALNGQFNGVLPTDHANYEQVVSTYLNNRFGFTLSYGEYAAYGEAVAATPGLVTKLCNRPVYSSVKLDNYECLMQTLDDAVTSGKVLYKEYIREEERKFRRDYIAYCSQNHPRVSLRTDRQTYHYTLYYYDQAGNLVRTVPPEGVHPLSEDQISLVGKAREDISGSCNYSGPVSNTNKATTLQELGAAFDRTSNEALEMWVYNGTGGSSQVLATTSSNKYMLNVCISGSYLTADVYTITIPTAGEADIVLSAHTTVSLAASLPLQPWVHVVLQGAGLNRNDLSVYVNGRRCAVASVTPTDVCTWELRAASPSAVFPENLGQLKQLRLYNRLLSVEEIRANAAEGCMSLSPLYLAGLNSSLLHWGKFNTVAAGSPGTIGGSSTENQYKAVYPTHTLTSSYAYQSLNKVNAQSTPDGGESHFWYDMTGRSVLSQNAEQLNPVGGGYSNRYGFIRYDGLGRTTETGEKYFVTFNDPSSVFVNQSVLNTFYAGSWNSDLTRTYYDVSVPGSDPVILSGQTNLRKRISAVKYERDGAPLYATYYSYDAIGNVSSIWHATAALGVKRIDYKYDLVSGKMDAVRYQRGWPDEFHYGYEYDADNRLIRTETGLSSSSTDGWKINDAHTDARYVYYPHGLLARMTLGDRQLVQGIDYAYTLQGWLKGVNGNYLQADKEIGGDGVKGGLRATVGRDVMGYSLDYFKDDYTPISNTAKAFSLKWIAGDANEIGHDQYTGNISRSTLSLKKVNETTPVGYSYRYDQLGRLKETRQHELVVGASGWNASTAIDAFKESVSYDANGNILSYLRNGSKESGLAMDQLSYVYNRDASGNLLNNRLSYVTDAQDNLNYKDDIKTQGANNYKYDNIGNLIADAQGGILSSKWSSYGKLLSVVKADGSVVTYEYDISGNRSYKSYIKDGIEEKTYYVRDPQGNVLAVYGNKDGDNELYWKEQHLYGNSRIGLLNLNVKLLSGASLQPWSELGNKQYELTNQLGNVLATISDKPVSVAGGAEVDHYDAEVLSAQDYYPFGMLQPDRKWNLTDYRYGFNGQEKSNEINGVGNSYTSTFWEYDPRLGRRWNVDPATARHPNESPYLTFHNNPGYFSDPLGDDPPEGFKKHNGRGGDLYLPQSATLQTTGTENNIDGFTIGKKTFNAKYDQNGVFIGYFNKKTRYNNPDVTLRPNWLLSNLMSAYFDVKNVPAKELQIVQTFYGSKRKDGLRVGVNTITVDGVEYPSFVDGGKYSPAVMISGLKEGKPGMPYYVPLKEMKQDERDYGWDGENGHIRALDQPNTLSDHEIAVFETTIIAVNYMQTGKDVKLATFRWSFNNYGSHDQWDIKITPITNTSLEIIKKDYPYYEFFK